MRKHKRDDDREAEAQHRRELGLRMRMVLADKGMPQHLLAEAMDVKPSVVSRWLHGKMGMSTYRLQCIAAATECSAADLLPPDERKPNRAAELGEIAIKKLGSGAVRRLLELPEDVLRQWATLVLRTYREVPTHLMIKPDDSSN